jgi:hypothetical protein
VRTLLGLAVVWLVGPALRDAHATSIDGQIRFLPARPGAGQPLNSSVLVYSPGIGEPVLSVRGPEPRASLAVTPLVPFHDVVTYYLVRPAITVPGPLTLAAMSNTGALATSTELQFTAEEDESPPALAGLPSIKAINAGAPGTTPGPSGYLLQSSWPPANETAFVRVVETDAQGVGERVLWDLVVDTMSPRVFVLPIPGELGRAVCFRWKTVDLSGNETALGPVCCADQRSRTGPCPEWKPLPGPVYPDNPDAAGCTLAGSHARTGWFPGAILGAVVLLTTGRRRRRDTAGPGQPVRLTTAASGTRPDARNGTARRRRESPSPAPSRRRANRVPPAG